MTENIQHNIVKLREQIDSLIDKGQLQEAINLEKQVQDYIRQHLGEDNQDYAKSLYNLGLLFSNRGDYGSAVSLLRTAWKLRKDLLGEDHVDCITNMEQLAILYKATGEYEKAIPLFEKCLECMPENEEALENLVDILFETHQYDIGEEIVRRIIRQKGESTNLIALLFIFLNRQEKFSEMEKYILNLLTKGSQNAILYEQLSFAYENLEQYDRQEQYLLEAINRGIESFNIFLDLGNLYAKQNKKKSALKAFSKAQKIIPEQDYYWIKLGEAYINIDEFNTASEVLESAKDKYPVNIEIDKILLPIYLCLGKETKAKDIFKNINKKTELENDKNVSELASYILETAETAEDYCPKALGFLEEAYHNLPNVDTSEWNFGTEQFQLSLFPKWIKVIFSYALFLKAKNNITFFKSKDFGILIPIFLFFCILLLSILQLCPSWIKIPSELENLVRFSWAPITFLATVLLYLNRRNTFSNTFMSPAAFMLFGSILFLPAIYFFQKQNWLLKNIGISCTIGWGIFISLSLYSLISKFMGANYDFRDKHPFVYYVRIIISYILSIFTISWFGSQVQQVGQEMYYLGGKVIRYSIIVFVVFNLLSRNLALLLTILDRVKSQLDFVKIVWKLFFIGTMFILGIITAIKCISFHFLLRLDQPSFSTAIVQICQAMTLPISAFFCHKIYYEWQSLNRFKSVPRTYLLSFIYCMIIGTVISCFYFLLETEIFSFLIITCLIVSSYLLVVLLGPIYGGFLVTIRNRYENKLLPLAYIFLSLSSIVALLFLIKHKSSYFTNYFAFSSFRELAGEHVCFSLIIITYFFLLTSGIVIIPKQLRLEKYFVRRSDYKLQPVFYLSDKILSALGHEPNMNEYYASIQASLILFDYQCIFLPLTVTNPFKNSTIAFEFFGHVFKESLKKPPFDWIYQCLSIKGISLPKALVDFYTEFTGREYVIENNTEEINREELTQKIRKDAGQYAALLIFLNAYEKGDYLLRRGNAIEAINLYFECLNSEITSDLRLDILFKTYYVAELIGSRHISAQILSKFKEHDLTIRVSKFRKTTERLNLISKQLEYNFFEPFYPAVPFSTKFTESMLLVLEAGHHLKEAQRNAFRLKSREQTGMIKKAEHAMAESWKNIDYVTEKVTLALLCQAELNHSIYTIDDSRTSNNLFIKGLSFWYLDVLQSPVSGTILPKRSESLSLRLNGLNILKGPNLSKSTKMFKIGMKLLEWIEQSKLELLFNTTFSFREAEMHVYKYNLLNLQFYQGNVPSLLAIHLMNLSKLLYKRSKYEEANKVLQHCSLIDREELTPVISRDLAILTGQLSIKLGQNDSAVANLEEALKESALVAQDLMTEEQVIDFNAQNAHLYNLLIWEHFKRKEFNSCLTLLEKGRSESLAIMMRHKLESLEDTELERDENWVQLEVLRSKIFQIRARCSIIKGQSQRDMVLIKKLSTTKEQLHKDIINQNENEVKKVNQKMIDLDREYTSLIEKFIVQRSTDMDYLQPPPPFEELCSTLEEDEAFVIIHEDGNNCLWFIATRNKISGHNTPSNAKDLAKKLIEAVRSPESPLNAIDDLLERLSNLTLTPLFRSIDKLFYKKRRIYFVPMGIWSDLPLSLLKQQNMALRDEDWRIATLPSASILHFLSPIGPIANGFALGIGDPELGSPELRLPYAALEVTSLLDRFPESEILLGSDATIYNFFNAIKKQPSIIHIACHGEFNPEQPMLSTLRLTPSNRDDGSFHGHRLRYHGLGKKVDLCILSACWSGRLSIAGFNEQIGFARTLLGAGASSLISSLWAIDDQSTEIFFKDFYNFLNKFDPAESLEKAMTSLREDERYQHPYYWAPFIYTGALQTEC